MLCAKDTAKTLMKFTQIKLTLTTLTLIPETSPSEKATRLKYKEATGLQVSNIL
jgi:hypothetical protein